MAAKSKKRVGGSVPPAVLTVRELAGLVYRSFELDSWGDIDPWWFKSIAESEDGEEMSEDALALRKVLDRVVEELNKRYT